MLNPDSEILESRPSLTLRVLNNTLINEAQVRNLFSKPI